MSLIVSDRVVLSLLPGSQPSKDFGNQPSKDLSLGLLKVQFPGGIGTFSILFLSIQFRFVIHFLPIGPESVISSFLTSLFIDYKEVEGALPKKTTCYEGVFCNYFSIGMLTCRTQLMFRSWQYVLESMINLPFNPFIDGDQAC